MTDAPGKRVLYICLMGLSLVPAFVNPQQREIGVAGSLACLLFVLMYIRSDRKREEARRRGFPVIPKMPPQDKPSDSSGES